MFSFSMIHIFVMVGYSLGIKPPFISEWQTIAAQVQSPIYIPHSLGEMPIKVDVQVRVVREGSQHIFSGFGAGQRSDEDGDSQYGAVLFSYNESHVRLHVPVSTITTKGGLVSTAGFVGPFDAYYTTADARVRAWRICDFPPANFSSNIYGVGGPPYTPGGSIPHNLGVTPDLVIVQLKMLNGFVYEADGAVFKDRRISSDRACGTVMAYDNMNIRIWGMAKRQGIAGLVGCAYRGWGTQYMADLALLIISAWILPSEDKVVSFSTTIAKNTAHLDTVPLSPFVSIDTHLFIVKVKATEGNNNGFIFHGAGTSLTDGSLTNYGGVLFGYNESEVLLWRPADSNTNGYIWYRDGDLGGGDFPQASTTAEVTVDILRTVTPIEGNCGPGKCVGDWAQIVVVCDCFGTGLTGQYCSEADGPPPSTFQASVQVNEDPNLHLGYKRKLTIKLMFPMGTTPDIVVSVRASDTKEIMAIGSLVLNETGNNIQPLTSSFSCKASTTSNLTGFHVVKSASLSFGDVVNTGLSSLYMNNMVTIETEVYVQSVDDVTDGDVHAVKIQVLRGGIVVWNKDIIYTINTTLLIPIKTPEVFTTFPVVSDLQRGSITRIIVDIWMPLANPDIVVEVRNSKEDGSESALRVVRLSVTQIGENYQLPAVIERLKIDKAGCHDVMGNTSLSLVFPTHFANKEAFVPGPTSIKDLIQFEALLYMGLDSEVWTTYPLDFIIYVDAAILWNSSFSMTSTEPTESLVPTNIDTQPPLSQLKIGQVFSTDVNLTLSNMGVFKFNVSLTSLIVEGHGRAGLILLSAAIVETGSSVVCSSLTASYNRTESSKIQNVADVFLNVTNFGSTNVSEGNSSWLVLRFNAVAAPGYTGIGEVHTIEVRSGALSVVYIFSITGTATFDQNLVYMADIYHFNTGTCLSENQSFELFVNITTERSKTPGPLYVHFPFGNTVFSVHEYKIIHVGENLRPCFQTMQLNGYLDQYLIYSDGSVGNITLEFPMFCNQELSTDAVANQLTIRVVARIRNDIRTEGSSLNSFTVVVRSCGLFSDVTSSLRLIVKSMTILPKTDFVTGVEISKYNLNITVLPLVCHIKCSTDDQSFSTTTLEYERENATHVVYAFESRCMASIVVLEDSIPGNTSSCCVIHQFITLNVEDNFMIFNDVNETLRSKIPSVVDGSNDTCINLPVLGQTPPILWMRMNISGIWGLFSSSFRLSIIGNNMNCDNQNDGSVLKVFYPSSILLGDFRGDVTYCFLSDKSVAPPDSLTRCSYQCPCVGPQCLEAFLYIASSNVSQIWKLCELLVENV